MHKVGQNGKSLESWIWDAACSIRGAKDAPKYKEFILPLIFTKRLCDVFDDEINRIAQEVGSRAKAFKLVKHDKKLVRFFLPLAPKNPDDDVWSIIRTLSEMASRVEIAQRMIRALCVHMRGRKGNDPPSQRDLVLSGALEIYLDTSTIQGSKRKIVIQECDRIADERLKLSFSGDPWEDWVAIRRLLAGSAADSIRNVADDAKYLRILHKGAVLRSRLNELWRAKGTCTGAADSLRDALLQEHFSSATKNWSGIHVMTIHKAKGKEFDEVIVYEGCHQGRIVHFNAPEKDVLQARLALRVAVTRAMKHVTILTPKHDVCCFL